MVNNTQVSKYNPTIAFVLSIFAGAGNLYLGLYKRFISTLLLTIMIRWTLVYTFPAYGDFIAIIWYFYAANDSYRAAKAINAHKRIPKLLSYLDLK